MSNSNKKNKRLMNFNENKILIYCVYPWLSLADRNKIKLLNRESFLHIKTLEKLVMEGLSRKVCKKLNITYYPMIDTNKLTCYVECNKMTKTWYTVHIPSGLIQFFYLKRLIKKLTGVSEKREKHIVNKIKNMKFKIEKINIGSVLNEFDSGVIINVNNFNHYEIVSINNVIAVANGIFIPKTISNNFSREINFKFDYKKYKNLKSCSSFDGISYKKNEFVWALSANSPVYSFLNTNRRDYGIKEWQLNTYDNNILLLEKNTGSKLIGDIKKEIYKCDFRSCIYIRIRSSDMQNINTKNKTIRFTIKFKLNFFD